MTLSTKNQTILFVLASIFILFLLISPEAHASATSGGGLPYEGWLTKVRNSVTGPVAFTLSIVGIVGAGALLIFGGEINGFLKTLVFVVLVAALLVGAQNLLSSITGTGAEITMMIKPNLTN
ncbi:conjugal transfer protein TrbC [Phocoenobacter uteri]|uniref:Conjugal transfer protein TrbC n=1 Tax=Phocoenobacter uteri TaxID=146806 RepID=A0A379DF76_9PAST|nr:TrbC/VirB2 family protein [Phocoenobacter uteri]MDG6882806.1 conjugal transfer protein TrbC [Phocoenobacter uteri]MDG6882845.1 conjugal transfer protein TrbC [Phocoenobacter uteri]SUB76410.1 conjugal transfer protein TrbC [Phocoenobacter uteri]